jgi:hypothetical protein
MRIISPAPYDAGTAEREAAIGLVEDMLAVKASRRAPT